LPFIPGFFKKQSLPKNGGRAVALCAARFFWRGFLLLLFFAKTKKSKVMGETLLYQVPSVILGWQPL
jgi:hypothetical protein